MPSWVALASYEDAGNGAASVHSGRPPDASATVAGHHGQPDRELEDAQQPLEGDVPSWATDRQDPRELQDGHRHAQHAEQEGDQDQPEGPPPSPHNTDHQQPDEARERRQEGELQRTTVAVRQPQGLVVDLRRRRVRPLPDRATLSAPNLPRGLPARGCGAKLRRSARAARRYRSDGLLWLGSTAAS